jgi:hypothetical protein
MSTFRDISNPTDEEIRSWAYSSGGDYPAEMTQDWDLIVAEYHRVALIAELANDPGCESRAFFLSCLYLLSGQCVRYSDRIDHPNIQRIKDLIDSQRGAFGRSLAEWADRSLRLFEHPETFDYNHWCWHGFAYGLHKDEPDALTFLGRIRKFFNR